MKVELNEYEIIILKHLIKQQAKTDVLMSKDESFSEETRNILRKDFKADFNLFKKLNKALRG